MWVKWKAYGLDCIRSQDYAGAVASIYGINSLLPEKYVCEVNTEKHDELQKDKLVLICNKCNKETNRQDAKIYDLLLPLISSIISNQTFEKYWNCSDPNCNGKQPLVNTRMIRDSHKQPYYYKVIKSPPVRKEGLADRKYHTHMTNWFYDSIKELDHQLGIYREEYTPPDQENEDTIESGNENADRN